MSGSRTRVWIVWGCVSAMVACVVGVGVPLAYLVDFAIGVRDTWRSGEEAERQELEALISRLDAERFVAEGWAYDLAVEQCRVYRAPHGTRAWSALELPTDPTFLTHCDRGTSWFESGTVTIEICNFTPGAGGSCQGGGLVRTVDGLQWEQPVARARSSDPPRWAPISASAEVVR